MKKLLIVGLVMFVLGGNTIYGMKKSPEEQVTKPKRLKLVDTPLQECPKELIHSVENAIWIDEKELSSLQKNHIDILGKLVDCLKNTQFETPQQFNQYFNGINKTLIGVGIIKPVRFKIILKSGDCIEYWKLNGANAKKFFNNISEKYR